MLDSPNIFKIIFLLLSPSLNLMSLICNPNYLLKSSSNFLWLEYSAVATGLEKVSFHSNSKERQCQRMFKSLHNCTHLTH